MLKILMGPNVKILMGQSFGSWTHGHGPMALGAWAAAARPPPPGKVRVQGGGAGGGGPAAEAGRRPMPMCPGAKALAHEYFHIWAHKYF